MLLSGSYSVASQRDVDAARARLNVAQAKVRETTANEVRAARDERRMEALVAKEEVSRQQYDLSVAEGDSYHAQVESAMSQVAEWGSPNKLFGWLKAR